MLPFLEPLKLMHSNNILWVTLFRLAVATVCGGVIGIERGRKRRPAGFRTHMLVCIGATLAMLISQYLTVMTVEFWDPQALGNQTDVSRLGAQVINGIGFLGAGTIIVTGKQEVKGLTTAAGLWASACMGLCIGAGFVEGALVGCVLIVITIVFLTRVQRFIVARARDLHLLVEFTHIDDVGKIISAIKAQEIRIFDVEIHKSKGAGALPGAVFSVRLPKKMSHTAVLTLLAGVENVRTIEEL